MLTIFKFYSYELVLIFIKWCRRRFISTSVRPVSESPYLHMNQKNWSQVKSNIYITTKKTRYSISILAPYSIFHILVCCHIYFFYLSSLYKIVIKIYRFGWVSSSTMLSHFFTFFRIFICWRVLFGLFLIFPNERN